MRNRKKVAWITSILLGIILLFTSFTGLMNNAEAKPALSLTSKTLVAGQKFTLTISGSTGTTSATSSKKSVATVKKVSNTKYTVTAVKKGTATITVKISGKSYKCSITVISSLSTPALSTSAKNAGVSLSWKKITGAEGYKVYRKKGSGAYSLIKTIKSPTTVSYVDTKAVSNTTYTYRVCAYQGTAKSKYGTKEIKFVAPPALKVANTATGAKVSWTKIASASKYEIYRKSTGSYSKIGTATGTSFVDKTAKSGTKYTYAAKNVSKLATSPYSEGVENVYLAQTSFIAVSNQTEGAQVSWGSIKGAKGYYVYRKTETGSFKKIGTTTTSTVYIDNKVESGIKYIYTVRGYNGDYVSSYPAGEENVWSMPIIITWKNYDGTELLVQKCVQGSMPKYTGETPIKLRDAEFTYTFSGWTPAVVPATEDAEYVATFSKEVNYYTIIFKNEDGTQLESALVKYGAMPAYKGATPTKESTAQYEYTFAGWDKELVEVTENAEYTATFDAKERVYDVIWQDENGTLLQKDEGVEYGTVPVYRGKEPSKENTVQYTYTFAGWTPQVAAIEGNTTYTATYTETVNNYKVQWNNFDGTSLGTEEVPYGTLPEYKGAAPTKPSTAQYDYVFEGWTPAVSAVTGNSEYTASFKETPRKYKITWLNYDDSVLEEDEVEYGQVPAYKGATPEKPFEAEKIFIFDAWSPVITSVTGDQVYKATFTEETDKRAVRWINEGVVIKTDYVDLNTMPAYEGETPTKAATSEYTYTFAGWDKELTPVTENVEYNAVFDSKKNKYQITWKNEDGTILSEESVDYGTVPVYKGATPEKKSTAQYEYAFVSWDTPISEVTTDKVYTATFRETKRKYTVTWKNYDKTVLTTSTVEYGVVPQYTGKTPERPSKGLKVYTFKGWDKVVKPVTANVIYIATYEEKQREDIAVDYKVVNGAVVDQIRGVTMSGATVSGDHWSGGTMKLDTSLCFEGTVIFIMEYNRTSGKAPIDHFGGWGEALRFRELENIEYSGTIKMPFGIAIDYVPYILRATINSHNPVLKQGDGFYAVGFSKSNGHYFVQLNDSYTFETLPPSKSASIWDSSYLSPEHKYKEIIVLPYELSAGEIQAIYEESGIKDLPDDAKLMGRTFDGITDLGASLFFEKEGIEGPSVWKESAKTPGTYTGNDNNGLEYSYTIRDYVEPDLGIDHSKYESLHIIKNPKTLYAGYKYALSAIPYPFNVNHGGQSDQFDVSWKSSDPSIASVIDGLVITKKPGTVTITATLRGTGISDSCEIQVLQKEVPQDKVWNVPANYVSKEGRRFNATDYLMTSNAIFDAIEEAFANGYNHIVFPKIDFYVTSSTYTYYIPTGMTVEFPEGSAIHMMPSEKAKTGNNGYIFMSMGWQEADSEGRYFTDYPVYKATTDHNSKGKAIGYYCDNAHLIVDKYYGEFYDPNATEDVRYKESQKYDYGCQFVGLAKNARYCTVEVHTADSAAGWFIMNGGKVRSSEMKKPGDLQFFSQDFRKGRLDDNGNIVSAGHWIVADKYGKVCDSIKDTDILHEFYMGEFNHGKGDSSQHFYDIAWYDANKALIQVDRWRFVDEIYDKPENAAYFRVSVQQDELPTMEGIFLSMFPASGSRFCEVKNTNIKHGTVGLLTVCGETEANWYHNNYVDCDGYRHGWSLNLEEGFGGMRGTIIENNIFRKYYYKYGIGDYRGTDTGKIVLSAGFNTFLISNYIGCIIQAFDNITCTHVINNTIYGTYSSFDNRGYGFEMKSKIWGHVYYNNITDKGMPVTAYHNGTNYYRGNNTVPSLQYY